MRFRIIVFLLIMFNALSGQQTGAGILSDNAKLAEYMYIHMHYPLMAMLNREEGTAVYKFVTDSVRGFGEMKVIKSSGSGALDSEGIRLLWQVPREGREFPIHEISINFSLEENKIYQLWEVLQDMPEFPGGDEAMLQFILNNLQWPPEAAEMGIQGRIICGFVIEKDGFVSLVEVKRPLHRLFDAEAMRVIKRMPPWKPGKKNGKPVRVYYELPINIRMY